MADASERFINRELSWLEFNQRVIDEAANEGVPLMDRLFFLSVTGSNLDEFFMVRVGGLELLRQAGVRTRDPAGLTPIKQLAMIRQRVKSMVEDQYSLYRGMLQPELAKAGLLIVQPDVLSDTERVQMQERFKEQVLPVLAPMPLSLEGNFPLLHNLELYVGIRLAGRGAAEAEDEFAAVPVSRGLDRFLSVARDATGGVFVFIEDVVIHHAAELFPGRQILEAAPFRITRNADMRVEEEFAEDLAEEMERVLKERRTSGCVRLEVGHRMSPAMANFLAAALEGTRTTMLRIDGPLDLTGLRGLVEIEGRDELHFPSWTPQPSADVDPNVSLFEQLAGRDILVSLPFESFDPVVRLIREAAEDPGVLAIKQILYRTSPDSPVVQALRRAAENGKYVTAIVELKARFDEARNIAWARTLEVDGVQVVYSVKGLKTHGKICVVVRREREGIVRYMHFGTGNYNEKTARLYTDVGLLTRDQELGDDASAFFNAICGHSEPRPYTWIEQSPLGLRNRLLELIANEAARKQEGQRARIMAKMNSLADPALIEALYGASQAGVEILLNVRGICCLRPGVPGLSDNIRVVSIIDRFLEHSRIFHFHHGGSRLIYISSADWMPRNLDRRVELLVPVRDKTCRRKLEEILDACFADTTKASVMGADGTYARVATEGRKRPVRCQELLYQKACEARTRVRQNRLTVFEPHRPPRRTKS